MTLDKPQKGRVLVGDTADRYARAEWTSQQRVVFTAVDGAMRIGNWIAVRIYCRPAEHLVDPFDQPLRDGVFEVFGFVVHFRPAHPHHLY